MELSEAAFDDLVSEALDAIPPELSRMLDNVAVLIEDEPPPEEPDLLGVYEGTPLTERDDWYGGALPDTIRLFQGPIQRICHSVEEVAEEVRITVVHEIAHHFGIEEDRLHELGWG